MTESKLCSYSCVHISTDTDLELLFLRTFLSIQSWLWELLHMHNVSCHTIKAFFFYLLIRSLHFVRLSVKKKKKKLLLSECLLCLDDYLYLSPVFSVHSEHFHTDHQVLIINLTPLFASSVKSRSYLNSTKIHAWGWGFSLSLSLSSSPPPSRLFQPFSLSSSLWTFFSRPLTNLSLFLNLSLSWDPHCLSEVFVNDVISYQHSDWISQESMTTTLFFLAIWT